MNRLRYDLLEQHYAAHLAIMNSTNVKKLAEAIAKINQTEKELSLMKNPLDEAIKKIPAR